jgi:hypothetical protein
MSTTETVEAAEAKMNAAKEALLKYVESGESVDHDHYSRLVARVKRAEADFMKALSDLGS